MMARVKYIAGIMGLQLFVAQLTPEDGGGILYAADIVFNMSFEWQIAHSQVSMMFGSVFMHEAGHAVGIKDNPGGRMQLCMRLHILIKKSGRCMTLIWL